MLAFDLSQKIPPCHKWSVWTLQSFLLRNRSIRWGATSTCRYLEWIEKQALKPFCFFFCVKGNYICCWLRYVHYSCVHWMNEHSLRSGKFFIIEEKQNNTLIHAQSHLCLDIQCNLEKILYCCCCFCCNILTHIIAKGSRAYYHPEYWECWLKQTKKLPNTVIALLTILPDI